MVNRNIQKNRWKIIDLWQEPVGSWEPTYDTEPWEGRQKWHLFVQKVEQVDAEGLADIPAQMIYVLQWTPK